MIISIKVVGMLFVIMLSSYLGFLKAQSYEKRVNELVDFLNALVMFKSKIEFTKEPIKNIFNEISIVIYHNEENVFLNCMKIKNKEFYLSWQESISITQNNLNKKDKKIISNFGKMLGKTDVKGQINEILLTKSLIEVSLKEAEEERDKNVKLYKTLGICLGLFICIVLI